MRDAVPSAAGAIRAAELSGELVEVLARPVVTLFQHDFQRRLIARGFGQFLCAGFDDGAELRERGIVAERVVDVLPGATVLHESGLAKLREVTGDSRLAHAENFLDLDDGQLVLREKQQEAEARFVRDEAERFYD